MKLGATNEFPRGKLNKHDEGGIRIAVGHQGDCVVVRFGSPVAWLGMPKEHALAFAASIIEHAKALPDDHPTQQ